MVSFGRDSLPHRGPALQKALATVVSPHQKGQTLRGVFTENCLSINKQLLRAVAHTLGREQGEGTQAESHRGEVARQPECMPLED